VAASRTPAAPLLEIADALEERRWMFEERGTNAEAEQAAASKQAQRTDDIIFDFFFFTKSSRSPTSTFTHHLF
jgi:hypothetical protein